MSDTASVILPRLRDDLKLLPASPETTGEPAWSIYDPTRNRYFRIGPLAFEFLSRWSAGTAVGLVRAVRAQTAFRPDLENLQSFLQFLYANSLVQRDDPEAPAAYARIAAAARPPWWQSAIHNYLFFRLPLVRPTAFLRATQPIADLIASRPVAIAILLMGILGLFLVSRQWDLFTATFVGFLNWQGIVALAVTLAGTKVLHELGHAYTMTRHGGRVPTMGVAFLVLYPVLYTDTSDAWRLTSRRARLAVGLAGIRVELALALVATFLWSFIPDGPLRSAVFLVATATWLSTLAINLSPFLRFDGYYILSDWLNIANLQPRAFALTRWWLREVMFAFGEAPPERFPAATRRFLILYSIATWLYRLALFIAIALLVYHLFFKLAGILLFAIEIVWLIAMPIVREFRAWFTLRHRFRPSVNLFITMITFGGLIWLLTVPWETEISAPVLVQAAGDTPVQTAVPGRLAALTVAEETPVEAGTVLARLDSPELVAARAAVEARLRFSAIELKQARLIEEGRGDVGRLEKELRRLQSARERIEARLSRLTIVAAKSGTFRDIPAELGPGQWLASQQPIGRIVAPRTHAIAYVDQSDLMRIETGASVRIIAEDPVGPVIAGRVTSIDARNLGRLNAPHLASPFGGDIAATRDAEGEAFKPLVAVYRVDIDLPAVPPVERPMRGRAFIEAQAESPLGRLWRTVATVAIRESGF